VVLLLYGLSSLVAVFSLLQSFSHNNRIASVIVIVFCGVAWMGIQYLEFMEFTLVGRFLFRGDLQRTVKAHIDLDAFRVALADMEDPEGCYGLVRETAGAFGFNVVQGRLAGQSFAGGRRESLPCWTVRIPLDSGDFLELERGDDATVIASSAGPFLHSLQPGLIGKSRAFHAIRDRERFAVPA
jgi:hypothetical protein